MNYYLCATLVVLKKKRLVRESVLCKQTKKKTEEDIKNRNNKSSVAYISPIVVVTDTHRGTVRDFLSTNYPYVLELSHLFDLSTSK